MNSKQLDPIEEFRTSLKNLEKREIDQNRFWDNFVRALDAEPREHREIVGTSGIKHKLLGLGVNDKDNRLVLIADTPSAEYAAMMQVDVSANSDLNVVVARPAAFNLPQFANALTLMTGSPILTDEFLTAFKGNSGEQEQVSQNDFMHTLVNSVGHLWEASARAIKLNPVGFYQQLMHITGQLRHLKLDDSKEQDRLFSLNIGEFANFDVTRADRELGVCPVPLFEFDGDSLEHFLSGKRVEDLAETLRNLDVYQYFFPDPSRLGLGLVDQGITSLPDLQQTMNSAPSIGHPYSASTEQPGALDVMEYYTELVKEGQLSEVEFEHFAMTDSGKEL